MSSRLLICCFALWWVSTGNLPAGQNSSDSGTGNGEGALPGRGAVAVLRWKNGDLLPGRLQESRGDRVRWSSPLFQEELVIDSAVVDSILFQQPTPEPAGAFLVTTVFGDLFSADLTGSDNGTFLVSNSRLGRVRLDRDKVYSLSRRVHPNLVFDGSRFSDWRLFTDGPIEELTYRVYRWDPGWEPWNREGTNGQFPNLSELQPTDRGSLAAGFLDPGLAGLERRGPGPFGMIFEGQLRIEEAGTYRFGIWADDRARILIDGRLVGEYPVPGEDPGASMEQPLDLWPGLHTVRAEFLEMGGAFGLKAWMAGPDSERQLLSGTNTESGWGAGPGGMPRTDRKKSSIFRSIQIPERFEMEVELVSSVSPRFVLALGKNRLDSSSIGLLRLETWDNELVIVQDDLFEPVLTIEKQRDVRLRFSYDSDSRQLDVFNPAGRVLLSLLGIQPLTGESGIFIRNRGEDLTVRWLRVFRHSHSGNGEPVDAARDRVHLVDGQVLYGNLIIENGMALVVDSNGTRQAVDLEQVDRVACPDVALSDEPISAELSYGDGAVLHGEVESLDADRVTLRTGFSPSPVVCSIGGASSIRFTPLPPGSEWPDRDWDRLSAASLVLRGKLAFETDRSPLGWIPEGAERPLTPAAGAGIRIERNPESFILEPTTAGHEEFPNRVHLKNGELFPCRVLSLDETTLRFRAPCVVGRELSSPLVKAVEFAPGKLRNPAGSIRLNFSRSRSLTSGWRTEKESEPAPAGLDRALTIPRFARGTPPSHILVAKTGDLKRGRLVEIRSEHLRFESKLREITVPVDRIARVVEVSRPLEEGEGTEEPPPAPSETNSPGHGVVRAVLTDGSVLVFEAHESTDGELRGRSSLYGEVEVPIETIVELTLGGRVADLSPSMFSEWVVRPAREPEL